MKNHIACLLLCSLVLVIILGLQNLFKFISFHILQELSHFVAAELKMLFGHFIGQIYEYSSHWLLFNVCINLNYVQCTFSNWLHTHSRRCTPRRLHITYTLCQLCKKSSRLAIWRWIFALVWAQRWRVICLPVATADYWELRAPAVENGQATNC